MKSKILGLLKEKNLIGGHPAAGASGNSSNLLSSGNKNKRKSSSSSRGSGNDLNF